MTCETRPIWCSAWILSGIMLLFAQLSACSGASEHLKRGDELLQAELHKEALDEYRKAAKLEPENVEVQKRIAKVRHSLASGANEEGLSLLEMKDHVGAINAFRKAVHYDPDESSYRKNLSRAARELLAKGKQLAEKSEFEKSVELLSRLSRILPQDAETKRTLEEVKMLWAGKLFEKAEQNFERRLFGNALISLVRINELVGVYRGSAAMEAEARGEMRTAALFGVSVAPGRTRRKFSDHTADLVKSIEQVKIENCPTAELPSLGKARIRLKVAITDIDFEKTRATTTGEQKYQSGIRKVDNPKFIELKRKITDTRLRISQLEEMLKQDEKIIEQAREAFADAGPSDDEESLRSKLKKAEKDREDHGNELVEKRNEVVKLRRTLSKTDRKLDEPVFDVHTYEIDKVTRTARVSIKVSAREEGGIPLIDDTETGVASTSDSTNPAKRKYRVKADPLRFPKTDEELIDDALANASGKIAEGLQGLCSRWHKEILSRARQASDAAVLEATEDYVLYLFAIPGKPPAEVGQFFGQHFDFVKIESLRGK